MTSMWRSTARFISNVFKLKPERIYVGKDLDGNTYHEIPPQRYFFGLLQVSRTSRLVVPPNGSTLPQASTLKVTKEWESWLRRRRDDPPQEDELIGNIEKFNTMQERVKMLEERERLRIESRKPLSHSSVKSETPKDSQSVDSWTGNK